MSSLSKREKIMLLLLGVVLIGFLYYKFVAVPQLNRFFKAQEALDNNKRTLQKLEETQKNIDAIKNQVKDLTRQAQDFAKAIPDTEMVPSIIVSFADMTRSSGAEAGRLSFGSSSAKSTISSPKSQEGQVGEKPGQEESVKGIMALPISYNVSGGYMSIMALLSRIEGNPRKMTVDKISISKDAEGTNLTANLSITSYFMNKEGDSSKILYPFPMDTEGKINIFQ